MYILLYGFFFGFIFFWLIRIGKEFLFMMGSLVILVLLVYGLKCVNISKINSEGKMYLREKIRIFKYLKKFKINIYYLVIIICFY